MENLKREMRSSLITLQFATQKEIQDGKMFKFFHSVSKEASRVFRKLVASFNVQDHGLKYFFFIFKISLNLNKLLQQLESVFAFLVKKSDVCK